MISKAGTDARRVVYVFVLGTGLVSTVISDVPVAAIFMTIALGILRKLELPPGQSNFGKAIMIGIPVAALVGGVGTPAQGCAGAPAVPYRPYGPTLPAMV